MSRRIYPSVEELIGGTPLVALDRIAEAHSLSARLLAKLEMFNPGGSAKDRVARTMLDDAEACGAIRPGAVIIEPTSGNTGIGLAVAAAARGYKTVIVMPDSMSVERRRLIQAYGAELVLTDGAKGMSGAIERARELADRTPNSFIPSQFTNISNPRAHFETTGPEIWSDTEGAVDVFVAGIGTGGTITGVGRYLKSKDPSILVVGVEPSRSNVLSGGGPGAHGLQGIGAGFIPEILDMSVVDEVITVDDEDAYRAGREAAGREGLLVGISSGAALHAAIEIAKRGASDGKNIVALLPDTGERYLSTKMFSE